MDYLYSLFWERWDLYKWDRLQLNQNGANILNKNGAQLVWLHCWEWFNLSWQGEGAQSRSTDGKVEGEIVCCSK